MGEPLQRIDTYDFAALYQRIEDGVVNGSAIAFAEQVVLAAHHRRPLVALHGIDIDMVAAVKGIATQAWP